MVHIPTPMGAAWGGGRGRGYTRFVCRLPKAIRPLRIYKPFSVGRRGRVALSAFTYQKLYAKFGLDIQGYVHFVSPCCCGVKTPLSSELEFGTTGIDVEEEPKF